MTTFSDCGSVLFVEGLLMCRRDVENLAGFGVFGAVGDNMLY